MKKRKRRAESRKICEKKPTVVERVQRYTTSDVVLQSYTVYQAQEFCLVLESILRRKFTHSSIEKFREPEGRLFRNIEPINHGKWGELIEYVNVR